MAITLSAAPTMLYVMPPNPTAAHRAQLVRSNKKLEQILGVTPSVVPLAPRGADADVNVNVNTYADMDVSTGAGAGAKRPRERGRLADLFAVRLAGEDARRPGIESDRVPLTRVSVSSTSTGTSDARHSMESAPESAAAVTTTTAITTAIEHTAPRVPQKRRRRPPMLDLSASSHRRTQSHSRAASVLDEKEEERRRMSVMSFISIDEEEQDDENDVEDDAEEEEDEDVLRDIANLPRGHGRARHPGGPKKDEKRTKLSRLARHFGAQPPLELVFPPSPASRSRGDPRRYTLGLPPPLVRGAAGESGEYGEYGYSYGYPVYQGENAAAVAATTATATAMAERPSLEEHGGGKVLQVFWDGVEDEQGRRRVMSALRGLRAPA